MGGSFPLSNSILCDSSHHITSPAHCFLRSKTVFFWSPSTDHDLEISDSACFLLASLQFVHGFLTVQHANLDMHIISDVEQNAIMVLSYRLPY